MDTPRPLIEYLERLLLKERSPAYLLVGHDGRLLQMGGALERFGLAGLKPGDPIGQAPQLGVLLPLETSPLVLPCVRLEGFAPADIHILKSDEGAWVLLLDAGAEEKRQTELHQLANQVRLLRERIQKENRTNSGDDAAVSQPVEENTALPADLDRQLPASVTLQLSEGLTDYSVLTGLLEALDFLVLDRVAQGHFQKIGMLPSWFATLQLGFEPSREPFSLTSQIPFLDNFLIDAERFWSRGEEGWIRSGPWVEIDSAGQECALEAIAVSTGGRKILLIQSRVSQFLEKRQIIQHARELSLEHRRLQRWEEDLIRKQQQLEDLIAARTQELKDSNQNLLKEIAGRRKAEETLRGEEQKFRTLIEECPFGVIWREGTQIKYINPTLADVFGCQDEDLQCGAWVANQLFQTPPSEQADSAAGSAPPTTVHAEQPTTAKVIRKDGVEKVVRFRSVWLGSGDEFLFLEDVTEQKRIEDHLAEAQKMEVVGTLAGGVAHDFNNLLQVIQGYAEILLMRRSEAEPEFAELQEIVEAAARGGELTRQLLTMSRRLESEQKALDLNEAVRRVNRLLGRTIPKMIEVELALGATPSLIKGDPNQLEQVLVNLAINARDAMPDGGKLTIKTSDETLGPNGLDSFLGLESGDYVVLTVADTGTGMDEETQKRMFEPFFTTKEVGKGAGLGLAMVYGIVKSHRGKIFCESRPGEGTSFRICFPQLNAPVGGEHSVRETPRPGQETILLVEDEESLRRLAEGIVGRFGYHVITEPNAERALERFRREHGSIDLVVLDVVMPGMGGLKCLKELLKIDPNAKIVVATGLADAKFKTEESGAKGFVAKPYRVGEFLRTIRDVLDKK